MKNYLLLAALALCACSPSEEQKQQNANAKAMEAQQSDRIKVIRLSVLRDDSAYGETRATFLIIDTKTGQEFIGVSGVGISETGKHSCGKNCYVQDER